MNRAPLITATLSLAAALTISQGITQERDQLQHWLDLRAADQTYALWSSEIGRTGAFLEFLGEGSIVFRNDRGPVDALEEYNARAANLSSDEPTLSDGLTWESHYIDVSRDGDLGLTAGPLVGVNREQETSGYGHLVSIWKKTGGSWELMADMPVVIPGFLSLEVEPDFEDTRPVLEETAHPVLAVSEENSMQQLIDADNVFGARVNFQGGQRALLSFGLENARVYLPNMGPAVGVEAASSVYGAYLDNELSTTNPISLTHMGGFMSSSKEMAYTYGTMETNIDDTGNTINAVNDDLIEPFRTAYLRLWRLNYETEWRIAVEVLRPF
ncbi:MAG: hypothetical protein QGG54_00780 [Gammaproteobacteria bacterium]|jgi:hypothetical protein|nr:hypothetical protein [Gammaproteobacteria bacterium]MDP6536126.1 hypothetical protein [Gammaproteobacteria bacterium]MDP6732518.1 hypothetical protein [Gammaproteobacteria bacterium]HAJ74824.1 hypothetical protein [Gammaproteobacteria bacterium]|tara:strand:- start:1959 stop:2939 length:981 start_codon:yes stop_codon:yes gene_type:complete